MCDFFFAFAAECCSVRHAVARCMLENLQYLQLLRQTQRDQEEWCACVVDARGPPGPSDPPVLTFSLKRLGAFVMIVFWYDRGAECEIHGWGHPGLQPMHANAPHHPTRAVAAHCAAPPNMPCPARFPTHRHWCRSTRACARTANG